MTNAKVGATGTVFAPGQLAAVAELPAGKVRIKIESWKGENDGMKDAEGKPAISEHDEILCVYPDGFRKSHQVKDGAADEELAPKVINTLRGRYGVAGAIKVLKLPKKEGDTLELEI